MVTHDRVLEIQLGNNLRFLRKRTFREVLGRTNKLVLKTNNSKGTWSILKCSNPTSPKIRSQH
jgi:hypothetical protein